MASQFTYPVRVLRQHATALEAALSVCLADPGQKAVHRLRTTTRRVEAQLLLLALVPGAPEHREAAATLHRELRRLRRAAGEVRDVDVHRQHLEAAAAALGEAASPGERPAGFGKHAASPASAPGDLSLDPGQPPPPGKGLLALRDHLHAKREEAALALQHLLTKRQTRAALAAEALLKALRGAGHLRLSVDGLLRCAETVLYRDRLLGEVRLARLDEEELHALRKSAKAARYLAETLPGNSLAAAAADRFEALQEAGGRWHDAVEITRAARKYLGKADPLSASLAAGRSRPLEAYREALRAFEIRETPPATYGARARVVKGKTPASKGPGRRPAAATRKVRASAPPQRS